MLIALIVFVTVGVVFMGATFLLSRLLRPHRPNPVKLQSYECGPEPFSDAWRQMNLHYYVFAILFVLFDVEAAFLFPVALALGQLGWYAFFEVLVFVGLLLIGWYYAKKVGGMEWER